MSLCVNLRHLEAHNVKLEGTLAVEELDIEPLDEVIQVKEPLAYHLEVQPVEDALLVEGRLSLPLQCNCVRCLKPVRHVVEIPHWTCHIPLKGEDKAPINNDTVDLTPFVREDILLEFPQHPLCDPECGGLPKTTGDANTNSGQNEPDSSAWAELNKLKFDNKKA